MVTSVGQGGRERSKSQYPTKAAIGVLETRASLEMRKPLLRGYYTAALHKERHPYIDGRECCWQPTCGYPRLLFTS